MTLLTHSGDRFKLTPESHKRKEKRMDAPATYFHWGFILISVPNLIVIGGMIVLFAIALIAPFPHAGEGDDVGNK
jgi:hypothetical protein